MVVVRKLQVLGAAVIVAGAFGAFPALAGGPNYGTWTYAGSGTKWHGTFFYAKPLMEITIQTKALTGNPVASFVIDGKKGHLDPGHGAAIVYVNKSHPVTLKKVSWTLTLKKRLASSKLINGCVSANGYSFDCRLGVP